MARATDENTTPLHFVDPIELRAKMSKAVDRLLAALDALDAVTEDLEEGDEDGEGEDAEPELGWTLTTNQTARQFHGNGLGHLEDEHDGREPDVDDEDGGDDEPNGDEGEPSLGSFDAMFDQEAAWHANAADMEVISDCEADGADHEPDQRDLPVP